MSSPGSDELGLPCRKTRPLTPATKPVAESRTFFTKSVKIPIELQEPFQRKVINPDPNPNNYIGNMNLHYFTLYFLFVCLLVIGVNAETKHTEYYDKLGVSPTADGRAIKKGIVS